MNTQDIISWLLEGDVSIQYQVHRDLLHVHRADLHRRIGFEGWGAQFLKKRKPNGHWGLRFYQPKWTSTHYTLLDLRNLAIPPEIPIIKETIKMILEQEKGPDGGIFPIGIGKKCDVCVNGMFLNYASYFKSRRLELESVVDFLLEQHMPDGGFNCYSNGKGAKHSSLHTTLSVLEGITEYEKNGYLYRLNELQAVRQKAVGFILLHQLFLSDRTGEIIRKDFLKFSYPSRWWYNILRALDYFQYSNVPWDVRMKPAIEVVVNKSSKQGTWKLPAHHHGQLHFEMEQTGKPSRWNTLIALRILTHYEILNSTQSPDLIRLNK